MQSIDASIACQIGLIHLSFLFSFFSWPFTNSGLLEVEDDVLLSSESSSKSSFICSRILSDNASQFDSCTTAHNNMPVRM